MAGLLWAALAVLVGSTLALFVWYRYDATDGRPFDRPPSLDELQAYGTFVAGVVGLLVTWSLLRRAQAMEEQVRVSAEQLRLAEQGQITERFARAVEQLGATDEQGEPRLEVRLGGIYSLERIARDSQADHWTVMEVLTGYVRHNVKRSAQADPRLIHAEAGTLRADIQAVLDVIRRRRWREYEPDRLNLRALRPPRWRCRASARYPRRQFALPRDRLACQARTGSGTTFSAGSSRTMRSR